MRILILGGTTEASRLAELVSRDKAFEPVMSFAGRTRDPVKPLIPTRAGGFGGIDGLAAWMREHATDVLVDATHPFAARISANAVAAAELTGVALLSIRRAPWQAVAGDDWHMVQSIDDAVRVLGHDPRRVFLTVGRLELAAFRAVPQHTYIVRTIDEPDASVLPPHVELMRARGPFAFDDEVETLRGRQADILVTKNSGGSATSAKLAAARHLRLPVIMVSRPHKPAGQIVDSSDAALEWLKDFLSAHGAIRSDRDV